MIPFSLVCALCFFSFKSVLSVDQNEIWMEKLAARVDALETKVADQNNVILELREELFETKQQLQSQLKEEEQVTEESADVEMSESTAHTENKHNATMQSTTSTASKHEENPPIRRLVTHNSQPVAFHAYFIASVWITHVTVGQAIAFPDVDLNLGGGYHSSTGLFIAPTAGVYIFSSTVFQGGNEEVHLSLYVNGDRKDGFFTKGRLQGSVTLTAQLKVGDEVLVKLLYPNDGRFYGGRLTSFTGCLITPL